VDETVVHTRLESERLVVRSMDRDDLDKMESWRPFTDPLCNLWNIPRSTSLSRDIWFVMHGGDPTRMWFAIERVADGQLIGTLSLREIVERTSGRLGISLGADYVHQGYGSEALRTFLPHYFRTLGFQRLLLDVAAANKRAIHVYAKLGFQQTGSHYRTIPEGTDLSFLHQAAYHELRPCFRRHFGRMELLFLDMALERRDWEQSHTPAQA
jgi:RimJ/RimL family protein N-acetyltransferase